MSPEQEALSAVSAAMARERKMLSDALESVKADRRRLREALEGLVAWMDESGLSRTKSGGVGALAYEGTEYEVVQAARAALGGGV